VQAADSALVSSMKLLHRGPCFYLTDQTVYVTPRQGCIRRWMDYDGMQVAA
jgi:hypothetical protein